MYLCMCGCGRLLRWGAIPMDIRLDPHVGDFNSPSGYLLEPHLAIMWSGPCACGAWADLSNEDPRSALMLVRRLRADALLFCGPPCSTWVWMSRGSTLRSTVTPLGDTTLPCVASANKLVARRRRVSVHSQVSIHSLCVLPGCLWLCCAVC